MRYYLSFGLPIVLLVIAFWFLIRQYRQVFMNWHKELTVKKILFYSVVIIVKAFIVLFILILIHNNFHDDHLIELTLFLSIFFVFAIVQSSYSFGGFLGRIQYIYHYAKEFFQQRSTNANTFRDSIVKTFKQPYSFMIKVGTILAFILVFTPNITVFVAANILYLFFIALLLIISMLLNNIIYFGIISLIVFQYEPSSIMLNDFNWYILTLTFLILLIGFVLETRMDNRMFFVKTVMNVKSFKWHLGYEQIHQTEDVIIYQNLVNHYYYFNYRITGLVIVYDSLINLRLSPFLARKMIQKGTQYLRQSNEM
jgi:hypothetical protein